MEDFGLLDSGGEFHQLSRYNDRDGLLLYVHQDNCQLSDQALAHLASFASNFRESSLLMALNPGPASTAIERLSARSISVLLDETGYISEALDISNAGKLLFIDPASREYRELHASDDQSLPVLGSMQTRQLRATLLAIEASQEAPCNLAPLPYQQRQRVPSYLSDVAPILEQRCSYCHREGGSAPWVMSEHRVVQGWAPRIRDVLLTRRMPLGQIDSDPDNFDGLNHISDEEMITLVNWIDAGASGDELAQGVEDPLNAIESYVDGWQLGV
ncbi:MAG: hypothetical protein QGG54_03140, partial [Gammaproteobacteria bacterium]|nr:hypothetical protein [Gammaproteobacteria bacterium]